MFEQVQQSKLQDDRRTQRHSILLYAVGLPIYAYLLSRVIKHWRTPGYEHGWTLAWVLFMCVGSILSVAIGLVRLRKLQA